MADIGAGTGIFSKLLLARSAIVDAVEPNNEMRNFAIQELGRHAGFQAYPGTAENTGLPSASYDLITCAQAFHWFDPKKTRMEFDRIFKARALVALIWNDQKLNSNFEQAYEEIKIKFGGENIEKVNDSIGDFEDSLKRFFGIQKYEIKRFDNFQDLDQSGLIGRFFSSSKAPSPDSSVRDHVVKALNELFERLNKNGFVRFEFETLLVVGH